ncbi:MAG: M12 family metallo-peptidase [Bacteroidota bacterium]
MKKPILLTVLLFILSLYTTAQVISFKNIFQQKNILQKDFHDIASGYQLLQLDNQKLSSARTIIPQKLEVSLPFENTDLTLDLNPATITSPRFSVIEASAGGVTQTIPYTLPSFYQGKIKGTDKSFAALSMFDNQVIGIMSDHKSNIILGSIEQNGLATNQYALYRDIDLKVKAGMNCFTGEIPADGNADEPIASKSSARVTAVGAPIEIYFECDYKFYQDKGSSVSNVVNYVLSFFNSVALLYARENIQVQVSQIKVWTTPDPYVSLTTTSNILTAFGNNMANDPYIGDYAHFLSTRPLGGGVAYLLNNPCNSTRANHSAVSAIDNTYKSFPTYSWTVEVVTHELGHNFGSNHTHWCGWPTGPIDGCGPTANSGYQEGTCAIGALPAPGGGTIMSYCHLLNNVGINLSNGFGPLPGDKIRTVIGAASCLGNCRMTMSLTKVNASCSQNNGSIIATPANGTGAYSYLWSNGQTGAALANVAPGIYTVTATDAAGCKVMDIDTITNAGTSLLANLTPAGTATFCSGNNLVLSATNNPAYTYQWYNNTILINGAVQSTYTINTPGSYSVLVTSGTCSVTKAVVVSQVTQPSASITNTGPLNFCTGNSVVLNANPSTGYQYQWYNNNALINGATNNTYTANTTGNYTVRVYSGSCESTSTAAAVNVVTSPQATITAGGSLGFCQGGNVLLTASIGAGYGYQWYRNNTIINGATQINYSASASGSYTVVTSLGTCTKTSGATNVTVFSLPVISIDPDSSVIEKYHTQTLTATGASSYNWSSQPSLVSSSSASSIVEPLTTTTYSLEGTDNNGCKGSATAKVIVIGCGDATGITSTVYSPSRTIIKWNNPDETTGDSIQYRLQGSQEWTSVYTTGTEYELNGLTPDATYEYRIIPLCSTTNIFIASATQNFKTASLLSDVFLKLFPNPVNQSGRLEIIVDKPFTLQVDIYNRLGQNVMRAGPSENLPKGQALKTINTSALSSGMYHAAVRINGKIYTLNMIVQH